MVKNKSKYVAACVICEVLTAFGLVASIISLINGSNGMWMVPDVVNIVLAVLIGYYAFVGFRKPHGNLLKYIILIYAGTRLISVFIAANLGEAWNAVQFAIIIGVLCYVAGRLHRIKQNIIFMGVVTILMVIGTIIVLVIGTVTIGALTPLIIWIDICVAYVLRYKEHKLAGLMDKAEN